MAIFAVSPNDLADLFRQTFMNLPRLLILTVGPFIVIGVAYLVAAPSSSSAHSPILTSPSALTAPVVPTHLTLADRCRAAASELRRNTPADFQVIVRKPFVLAGDLSTDRLARLHSDVVAPVARALQATYFDHSPIEPIRIVICTREETFRTLAKRWDGHLEAGYHGYYQRDKRRILLDLNAGNGSLAHELTHALSQADCEDLPEWFDEGFGALHEEATYASHGAGLIGQPNWRCRLTHQAARSGRLPTLSQFAPAHAFRSGNVGTNYAVARSWCLFLQERNVLARYYRDLRQRPDSDPLGIQTLCRVLEVRNERQAQQEFLEWLLRRERLSAELGYQRG